MKFGFYDRETAPFVLTPEYFHLMGGEDSEHWKKYLDLSSEAYAILRRNANTFLNLFKMVL